MIALDELTPVETVASKPRQMDSKRKLAELAEEGARAAAMIREHQRVMLRMQLRNMTFDEVVSLWWESQARR